MNIKPFDSNIRTIFETGFYRIPRFQRPYSWDRGNIEEFWNDVIVSDADEYFIGSMVFFKPKGKDELQVVDGQQRLTTITIFLAALRDAMADAAQNNLAKGVQSVIQRKDINDDLRFVLLTETSYPFFQEHIQKFGAADLDITPSPEEQDINDAYVFAREKFDQMIDAVRDNPTASKQKKEDEIKKRLQQTRDRLLSLQVIIVQLDKEDDAYVIFETLNTRGKDLEPADLVKTLLTRLLPAKSADVDATRTRWNKITRQIWESAANLDLSTYIHHFWLSREEYTSKKTLFKRIKSRITKSSAKELLDDLESGVGIYRKIFEPESFDWTKEERPVRASLVALMVFTVRQPAPFVFSLLRAYDRTEISLKQVRETLAIIERFHFGHTAIASISSSGGLSMMYALAARELYTQGHGQQRAKHLQDFRAKLRKRIPEKDVFNAGFSELRYTSTDTRQRLLIRYILGRIDEFHRDDKTVDYDKMTVEHIAPENPIGASLVDADDVGKVGNMIFVSEELNLKLKNKGFMDKKAALVKAGVPLDPILSKATKWTSSEIAARSKALAEVCYDKMWKS